MNVNHTNGTERYLVSVRFAVEVSLPAGLDKDEYEDLAYAEERALDLVYDGFGDCIAVEVVG